MRGLCRHQVEDERAETLLYQKCGYEYDLGKKYAGSKQIKHPCHQTGDLAGPFLSLVHNKKFQDHPTLNEKDVYISLASTFLIAIEQDLQIIMSVSSLHFYVRVVVTYSKHSPCRCGLFLVIENRLGNYKTIDMIYRFVKDRMST